MATQREPCNKAYARDKEENDILSKKKRKELDSKGIKYTFSYEKLPPYRHTVYPSPDKLHSFLRVPILKGLAKIVINYYLSTGGNRQDTLPLINAIRNKEDTFPQSVGRPYNPIVPLFNSQDTEICHTIYIKGDSKEGVLFAYVELIDFISALFIVNIDYSGRNFEKSYCFDLINSTEVKKGITYHRDRSFFLHFPNGRLGAGGWFSKEKLDRFIRVSNLEENRKIFGSR